MSNMPQDSFQPDAPPCESVTTSERGNLPFIPRRSVLKNSSDSTVNTASTSSSTRSRRSQVSFEGVQIRRYEMDLGDHPSCSIGAPVTLSWQYEQDDVQDIDVYECERYCQRRKSLRQLVLNYYQRKAILMRAGYSEETLKAAEREVLRQQRQRSISRWTRPLTVAGHVIKSSVRSIRWR